MDPAKRLKWVDIIATTLVALVAGTLLVTALFHSDEKIFRDRSVCSNNIRQIILSFTIYAQDNGGFPTVLPPARWNTLPDAPNPQVVKKAVAVFSRHYFGTHPAQRGSATACLWLLVLNRQLTPKTFICPHDPYTRQPAAIYPRRSSNYFDNFGDNWRGRPLRGFAESYSIACPWFHGKTAPWWTGSGEVGSDVPLMADMAPAAAQAGVSHTSDRYRNPGMADLQKLPGFVIPNVWNSGNHRGDGQNVGFGDDHVSWHNNPFCGDNEDNIYTTNPGPNVVNNKPTHAVRVSGGMAHIAKSWRVGTTGRYDTVMLPVQNITDRKHDQGF